MVVHTDSTERLGSIWVPVTPNFSCINVMVRFCQPYFMLHVDPYNKRSRDQSKWLHFSTWCVHAKLFLQLCDNGKLSGSSHRQYRKYLIANTGDRFKHC